MGDAYFYYFTCLKLSKSIYIVTELYLDT